MLGDIAATPNIYLDVAFRRRDSTAFPVVGALSVTSVTRASIRDADPFLRLFAEASSSLAMAREIALSRLREFAAAALARRLGLRLRSLYAAGVMPV